MIEENQSLKTLKDIKNIMERSSRFISLSGLSGISAGICALIGAVFAHNIINQNDGYYRDVNIIRRADANGFDVVSYMGNSLFRIAVITFIAAVALAFFFTYLRSRKTNTPLWGNVAKRLMIAMCIPLLAGGAFLLKLLEAGSFGLIAPGCLLFYGLALVHASRYTLTEVKYLGYGQILLGMLNLYFIGYGLSFWAAGFGILHIIYGTLMWLKYERKQAS